jgi:hypothetical protein
VVFTVLTVKCIFAYSFNLETKLLFYPRKYKPPTPNSEFAERKIQTTSDKAFQPAFSCPLTLPDG